MDAFKLSARDTAALMDQQQRGRVECDGGSLVVPDMRLRIGGVFSHEVIRNGESLGVEHDHNLVADQGINYLLEVLLRSGIAKPAAWYMGLFEGNYTPTGDVTGASVAATAVECVAYTQATRPQYSAGAAAARVISNSATPAVFTINASKTLYGGFLITTATKSDTVGTLLAIARFAASRAVVADDELRMTYSLTVTSL